MMSSSELTRPLSPARLGAGVANVTFLRQKEPIDEYGRALYAVVRSVPRAMLDQVTTDDLEDFQIGRDEITLRQMAKVARLERDKGMRGDGFEWAIHEAISGAEPLVIDPISEVLKKVSRHLSGGKPRSLLFGHERAQYLGFIDATIDAAGYDAVLLPDGRGHPYRFDSWVAKAAKGKRAEPELSARIKQIWKTDLFLTDDAAQKYVAVTVKSNQKLLEGGRGLRVAIASESKGKTAGIKKDPRTGLWILSLPDPNGFMGLFNDGYLAVAATIEKIRKHDSTPYYAGPSVTAQRIQEQLEKYPTAKVVDIENALDEAAQQGLLTTKAQLLSVKAPDWLHLRERKITPVIAPRPIFEKLD